ncbi:permease [Fodinicurvata sediminis]|uniref:permease n=1 Tax=Fodinicurvata sediminis TaxID=1121832 RepID=UPI00058D6649|nr:permease [Fodinicurvata sediminis]
MKLQSFSLRCPLVPSVPFDAALAASLAVISALALLVPDQLADTLIFTLRNLLNILPFLLFSILIAAAARATGADSLIARAFQGQAILMIASAALLGAISPFCSCGVIPLVAALLAMGVPLSAVMAFWLASPVMDPSMFLLTLGVLGLPFAVGKTLAAMGIGLLGGYVIHLLQRSGVFADPLRPDVGDGGCAGNQIRQPNQVVWKFWPHPERRSRFLKESYKNGLFLGKWLLLAFLLESLMLAYIPADMVVDLVGTDSWLSLASATLIGVPAYLNGYAALPLVGGLVQQGMAPGAAMAFLVAGGITSIPAAIAVFALARLPVFLAYVALALSGSLTAGVIYGLVV